MINKLLLFIVMRTDVYIYSSRMLINILWPPLDANQYGGPSLANWIYF